MIVQYVIDWHYVRSLIQDVAANNEKLDVIRYQLKLLRSGVMSNGVLFSAEDPSFLCELQNIIREDLKQTAGGETVSSWMNLSKELQACQKAYDEKCIRLPIEKGEDLFSDILRARNQMLAEANLSVYDLPCAIITNRNVDASGNTVAMTLDRYEDSQIERRRATWEGVSFRARNPNDENAADENSEDEADRFWAGLSIGASAFRRVSLIDPFCLCVAFRDSPHSNWDASMDKIIGFFTRNKFIENVTLVGRGLISGRTLHIRKLRARMQQHLCNMGVFRMGGFRIGICVKKPVEHWHNRWIDVGIAICALDDGLEVYKTQDGAIVIRKPFDVHVLKDDSQIQFSEVATLRNESYNDILKGICSVDESVDELKPLDEKNVVEFTVWPRIVLRR